MSPTIELGVQRPCAHDRPSQARPTDKARRARQRHPAAHYRDALSPTTKPGEHNSHACATGMLASNNALGAHTTRPGSAHDKDVRETEDFCRDRDSISRQTCLVGKKK